MRSYIRNVGTNGIYNESDEIMAGQIVFVAGTNIPNGYLECNGATVSRTTYATLFAAIGTLYGTGDGATTFTLPDLRGEFIRGADQGRGVDSGRAVGSAQADAFKAHTHTAAGTVYQFSAIAAGAGRDFVNGTVNTSSVGGTETRPRNIAMIAAIKFS